MGSKSRARRLVRPRGKAAMPLSFFSPLEVDPDAGAKPSHRVEIEISTRAILKVLGTLLLLWLLAGTWQVILWVIVSLMFVATFNPLVRRLQSRIDRPAAILSVVLLVLLVVGGLLSVIVPVLVQQGRLLLVNLPEYAARVELVARKAHVRVNLHAPLHQWYEHLASRAVDFSLVVFASLLGVITIFVLTIYLLIEGPQVATGLASLLPKQERLHARRMFAEIGVQVGAYMRAQLLTSLLAGSMAFVILAVLRVPQPLALAVWMMVADVVPIVGPIIGTLAAVLMALTRGLPVAALVLGLFTVYLLLEGNLIVPKLYGSSLKLSPLVVMLAFLFGAALLGMMGVLLALPVAASVPILLRYLSEWQERRDSEKAGPVPLP